MSDARFFLLWLAALGLLLVTFALIGILLVASK